MLEEQVPSPQQQNAQRPVNTFLLIAGPFFLTAMLGTVTYPLAVRVARSKRLFKLRNFYVIHLAIAPFLSLIHLNCYSFLQTLSFIKRDEQAFWEARPNAAKDHERLRKGQIVETAKHCEPYGFYFY